MTLTHKERVRRAIYRQPLDYFPTQIDFTGNDLGRVANHYGVRPEEIDRLVDNHLAPTFSFGESYYFRDNPALIAKAIEFDLARVDEDQQVIFDCWGVGWSLTSEGVWVTDHPFKSLENFANYRFPDPNADGLMYYTDQIVKQAGDEYFVLALQHIGLFERAWSLRGFENLLMDFYQNRSFVEDLLDRITDYQVAVAKRYVAAGIDGVRFGDDYGTQKGLIMKDKHWRELFKPRLKRIYSVYQEAGLPVMQHSCGDLQKILPDFVDMGLNMLHPVQPQAMPIRELVEKYGEKLSFFGGIDTQELLPFGTPEQVRASTKECVELLGRHGGYMIAPSQEIMSDVPLENIEALVNAVKEYRTLVPNPL
jgi:uroporphyrinogen decarboxylase